MNCYHKIRYLFIGLLFICSCQQKKPPVQTGPSQVLTSDTVSIDLEHVVWDRFSPTWWKPSADVTTSTGFEVLPAHDSLEIPELFLANACEGKVFRFTGQFFEEAQEYGGDKKDYSAPTIKYTHLEYLPNGKKVASNVMTSYKAYKALLRLDHRGRSAQYYIKITGCPNDSSLYYKFHVSVKASDGEHLRISKNSGLVEIRGKYTSEYKPLKSPHRAP